ncbi:MAG: CoB--CoM heterodisulfide reductase iron-sulfur subunit B family protein [Deltaproteobacteria bacterium]|nr:MAG: CoB--CoM heterodisulfide reductase iron-sulfur subunit B family protein [Deltaproteobacteria bacterium]
MKYALFLGCTIPARARNYELSLRKTASVLGIEFVDIEGFGCCGFPIKSVHHETFLLLAAKSLILAEEHSLDICCPCSACTSVLTEVNKKLSEDKDLRQSVVEKLSPGKTYRFQDSIRVRHIARVLYEDVGIEKIKSQLKRQLTGLSVAPHYGCHYLKPSEIYGGFDDPGNPKSLDELIEAIRAKPVSYEGKDRCCGGAVLAMNENISLAIAEKKLKNVKEAGADAISLICPFCSVMFDDNQRSIETKFSESYQLPVLYYTQLLGLALGFDERELGLNMNKVKTAELVARLGQKL